MSWNSQQEAEESMVRPGDALVRLAVVQPDAVDSGSAAWLSSSAPLEEVLKSLICGLAEQGKPSPAYVDLYFSGIRALPRLCVEEELGSLQDIGCDPVPLA